MQQIFAQNCVIEQYAFIEQKGEKIVDSSPRENLANALNPIGTEELLHETRCICGRGDEMGELSILLVFC